MFYYPAVLNHHSGCFSTIWLQMTGLRFSTLSQELQLHTLVATNGKRVARRDFLKVNVQNTCNDLMQYVLERVPPPRPGLPQPRFSLYLSSQLQYGLIMVFHRQCAILLEEIHATVGLLLKRMASQNIDMGDPTKQSLMLPDALTLLDETEGAQDPFFGVMSMHDVMPSPTTLIQMNEMYARAAFPEHPEITSPSASVAHDNGITASPDSITLREMEPVTIPAAEFEGVELSDQISDVLDLLMAETGHFPEGDADVVKPGEQEGEIERGVDRGRETANEITGSTAELQPTIPPSEEAMLLPQEEPGVTVEKPGPFPGQVTAVSLPALPSPPPAVRQQRRRSLELEDVPRPQVRRRRKRALIFFDPETQLPQEMLQQQIDDTQTETRPVPIIPSPARRTRSAAELFNNPCTFLPEEVLSLWKLAATITSVPDSDLQVGQRGPESEKETERETVEEERREHSPREVPRDLTDPEFSGLLLEGSDQRELSQDISPMFTSDREGSLVSKPVSVMGDIPEVMDEFLPTAAAESPRLFPSDSESAPVLFRSLLPPDVDRKTVSTAFQRLLENVSARRNRVKQDEPYGDILILPGL